jgi:hypothetical protein
VNDLLLKGLEPPWNKRGRRNRIKVAVRAFAPAKGDVEIEAGFFSIVHVLKKGQCFLYSYIFFQHGAWRIA